MDEDLHPACGALTFMASHRHTIQALGPAGVQKFLESTPPFSVTADWHEQKKVYVRDGFNAPDGAKKVMLYDRYLLKMEKALQNAPWLTGRSFTFADIAMTPYISRLDMLSMSGIWKNGRRPRVEDWYNRVKARTSYKAALLDWLPDDLRNQLRQNGESSWPEVCKILGIAATS